MVHYYIHGELNHTRMEVIAAKQHYYIHGELNHVGMEVIQSHQTVRVHIVKPR